MDCNPKYTKQDFFNDVVDALPDTERQIVCLLKQIRFLLFKISESIAPSVFTSRLMYVGVDTFVDVYKSKGDDRVIEIQNVSSLTQSPNDLIIRPANTVIRNIANKELIKDVGLILRPSERIRLHVPTGSVVSARFRDLPSIIAISELSF